jgi:glycerate-2-kinase
MSIIRNSSELIKNARSTRDREARKLALKAIDVSIESVDPKRIVESKVKIEGNSLAIDGFKLSLRRFKRITVVGAGKASGSMAEASEQVLSGRITRGLVNVLEGTRFNFHTEKIELQEASHPVPSEKSTEGTERMLELLTGLSEDDLVFCLISGGGSAMMSCPAAGISLADKQEITRSLLKCGATIQEINTVRKHLSRVKGGWLAKKAYPSTVVSLIVSDVVGDPLDAIASGPTAPDSTTYLDAINVLKKYDLWSSSPNSVRERLVKGSRGLIPDTPKSNDESFKKVFNIVLGNNRSACNASQHTLRESGLETIYLTSLLEGESREAALVLASIIREIDASGRPVRRPAALIAGGETTVTVKGSGKGGRNQEMVLSLLGKIAGMSGVAATSVGTDGVDGPTDAAGAIVDGEGLSRAIAMKLNPTEFLLNNDSYAFFSKMNDLIYTGPTRTNVNDLFVAVLV